MGQKKDVLQPYRLEMSQPFLDKDEDKFVKCELRAGNLAFVQNQLMQSRNIYKLIIAFN